MNGKRQENPAQIASFQVGTVKLVKSFDGGRPTLLSQHLLPKDPDRSHLADEIHFMDLIRLADEELPAARATVERSKAVAVTARAELDEHQRWLGRHQELYAQAVEGCERRLKRKAFLGACKKSAAFPFQLLTTAWTGLFHAGLAYSRRRRLKAKLKDRLQELDHPSEHQFARQLQERIQAMDRRGLR
jgi:hypothetical protein